MTKKIYLHWLVYMLIPHVVTIRQQLSDPILKGLLLIDSHNSHDNDIATTLCTQYLIDVLVFLAHSFATSQSLDLEVNSVFKSILNTHWKVKKDKSLEEKRVRLLSMSVMCLASALTSLWILEEFSNRHFFFQLGALLNSKLVIDLLTHIDLSLLKKKKCEHGNSKRLLTEEEPVSTVYLFVVSLRVYYLLPIP
jgi:DDE superfamily endonuclease